MAQFCLQSLGVDVSTINTVSYSNHAAYRQLRGRKTPASEVTALWEGLKLSGLHEDVDVLLSGYCPDAEVVAAVGGIAREMRGKRGRKMFWVLDPVMGDNGRIYVDQSVVPVYKSLIREADLILPNQFEAELLSGTTITDLPSLVHAISILHREHNVPHVIVTSARLPSDDSGDSGSSRQPTLSIVGSSATSSHRPRPFRITVPALPIFFSGTGDMFAALMVARLREAVTTEDWGKMSEDEVPATELPLARAAEKVLASMHAVLVATAEACEAALRREGLEPGTTTEGAGAVVGEASLEQHLKLTKAAEVRVVRNAAYLGDPPDLERFRARDVVI